jgi:hypothetical protein
VSWGLFLAVSVSANATVAEVRYMPAIIQFLGYNHLPAASSIPERLATAVTTSIPERIDPSSSILKK